MIGMYLTFLLFSQSGIDPIYRSDRICSSLCFGHPHTQNHIATPFGKSRIQYSSDHRRTRDRLSKSGFDVFKSDYRVIQTSYSAAKIELFGTLVSVSRLGAFIVAILAAVILYFVLMKTRIGMDIRAVSQDPEAAVLMGINDKKIFTITFGLGVGLVGIAAAIITPIYYIFPTVGESFSTISFIVVVLGGLGSFHGALIGGFIIGIVEAIGGIISSAEWARVFSY